MHAPAATTIAADPAYLAEPTFEGADGPFSYRRLSGDFIFTVELRGAAQPFGLQVVGGNLNLRTVTGADSKTGVLGLDAGAPTHGQVAHADVFQVERQGAKLLFSAAPFGAPLTVIATAAVSNAGDLRVGVYGGPAVEMRNARWTAPSWPGLVPYQDYLGSRLELLDVASGEREVLFATAAGIEAPNYTPDGKSITFNSGGRIYRFELATKVVNPIDTGTATRNNNDHVISFDGKWLGISSHSDKFSGQSIVYKVPIGGGEPIALTHAAPSYLHGWSPDGKYVIYTAERNGDFSIYRTTTDGVGKETQLTRAPGLDDGSEYAPDGKHIYFNSSRSGVMQLWRMDPDGGAPEQLTRDAFNNWFPHVSPDNQQLVFLSYQPSMAADQHPYYQPVYLRVMPAAGGKPRVVAYLYGGQGTINVPSWSPDGKYVAFISNTGRFGKR